MANRCLTINIVLVSHKSLQMLNSHGVLIFVTDAVCCFLILKASYKKSSDSNNMGKLGLGHRELCHKGLLND